MVVVVVGMPSLCGISLVYPPALSAPGAHSSGGRVQLEEGSPVRAHTIHHALEDLGVAGEEKAKPFRSIPNYLVLPDPVGHPYPPCLECTEGCLGTEPAYEILNPFLPRTRLLNTSLEPCMRGCCVSSPSSWLTASPAPLSCPLVSGPGVRLS
jgi:hypothetical protein